MGFVPDNYIFTTFAYIFCSFMGNVGFINTMLKRPLWVLMAVLCIVFSSASKRLIEMKMAPYFTVSQALGKKIKDGSREKREIYKSVIQPEKKHAGNNIPEFLFFLTALTSLAFILSYGRYYFQKGFAMQPYVTANSLPLYLRVHRLQV